MRDRQVPGGIVGALAAALMLLAPAAAEAASPFEYRGVVQGFYGQPYSHDERMRLLRFMGDNGFNTYVHAPKDELHHRLYWRQPYSIEELSWLWQEILYARSRGITFVPALSPAVPKRPSKGFAGHPPDASVCFSCPNEINVLIEKIHPLWQVGVRTFMLSFDDVKRELQWPQDAQTFGTGDGAYGRANAHLLNSFQAALRTLDPSVRVITVGADYAGTRGSAYLKAMRNNLASDIELIWTGPRVRSRPFSRNEARQWTKVAGRKPIVWENWTNQDFAPRRLFLGPWRRENGLAGEVKGFLFNPSFVPETNFLPLATAARWMASPTQYRPRRAFLKSAGRLAGKRAPLLRAFAEANYSTTLDPQNEAPTFVRLSNRLLSVASEPRRRAAAKALLGELQLVRRGARLGRNPALRPMVRRSKRFFNAAARSARAGELATRLLLAHSRSRAAMGPRARPPAVRRARSLRSKLIRQRRRMVNDFRYTFGNRKSWQNLSAANVMDRYVDRVLARTRPRAAKRRR